MAWWQTITLICFLFSVEAKFYHTNHHQKRETESGLCDPGFNNASIVQCYCAKDSSDIVRSAECYPTHEDISQDDLNWSKFSHLKNATKLVLTNTRGISFKYVPMNALKYTEKIIKIDVKYGNIHVLEAFAFANLSSVEDIRLSGNQIEKLSVHAFAHHKMLNTISLDTNNIVEINRDVFVDLPALEKLFTTNNKITIIHDRAFIHLNNLRELEIDRNKLFSLNSETFSGLTKLLKLDLSGNSLEVIGDNTFKPLTNLISLNLDGNKIQMLDAKAFHGLIKIQSLSLAHNEISEIENINIFKGLDSLTSLSLRGNRIVELKKSVLSPILESFYGSTGSLDLEDNNFPCDCRLEWVTILMNRTKSDTLKLTLENFKCLPDPSLRDEWMKRVEADKINNPEPEKEGTESQGGDYDYYDDTALNGKLFYIDIRSLLNCTNTVNKPDVPATDLKPTRTDQENYVAKELNTKVTAKPVQTTTIVTKKGENVLDTVMLHSTSAPEAKNEADMVTKLTGQESKPNVYTTSKLATVSAKPDKKHFDEDMASDEAKADQIKAHRSMQDKNDDYNDLFNNSGGSLVGIHSYKTVLFVTVLNVRYLFH